MTAHDYTMNWVLIISTPHNQIGELRIVELPTASQLSSVQNDEHTHFLSPAVMYDVGLRVCFV